MKKLFILLFVIGFILCTPKPQTDNTIFVDLDKPEKASLFDYFRSIELIPLETSSNVLIKGITKMIVHEDKYYALDKPLCLIFVFDKAGKFLFKIGTKGPGPREYAFIQDFNINPFSGNMEILEPYGRIHTYDLSGNFIETRRIAYPGFRVAHSLAALDSTTYVSQSIFAPKKILYFNLDEQKLLHEEYEEDMSIGSYANNPYQYQKDWFFFWPFHPVVYKMGKERLEVAFRFDFGKYTKDGRTAILSKESERNFAKRTEEMFDQYSYMIQAVRHNNKYIFASLLWKDEDHKANIIYDRSTGKSKYILDFDEKVWFNSYRGEEIIITDEYALMPIQWVDLEKRITKEMLDDKQKAILEKLLQADTEQNPILIKYWFK
ncbi:6-bladed beta-propeller [Parabacteroides pacaensis]|uniref:6-bladed beta-propeller n=1 Tax=Parabacteroides pacaensis TaxID=2086575 RepID=UPI000D0F4104|nr:6-bladed beta-propeller [Parabacteroides pacaensis]